MKLNTKTYADYIATRPRAERFGSTACSLMTEFRVSSKMFQGELNEYEGNVDCDHFSSP